MLPILLLSAAGFTVLTTEFIIVGLLPGIARDLAVSIPQAGLLVTLFAFTVACLGPFSDGLLCSIRTSQAVCQHHGAVRSGQPAGGNGTQH